MRDPLYLYVIYDHPRDRPEPFVVRRWTILAAGSIPDTEVWGTAQTLDQARMLIPAGLYCIRRADTDAPTITETWM